MSSIQTTATPINGQEAAEILKNQATFLIENTPGLDFASSYHRLTMEGSFKLKAYPADIEYPAKDFEFDINSVSTTKKENEDKFAYIERLETVRNELIHRLDEVTQLLDTLAPVSEVPFELSAGDTPDKLRIEQGLSIPVARKVEGRTVEEYTEAHKDKNTGTFAFGKGRNK